MPHPGLEGTFANENEIDWASVNYRNLMRPKPRPAPKVDELVSRVVGRKVLVNDGKLMKIVNRWRMDRGQAPDSLKPDEFLRDPEKIKELKRELG